MSGNSVEKWSGRMKCSLAVVMLLGLIAAGTVGASRPVVAQTTKSQWDGAYSTEQAKRGEPLYTQHCAACHGADLSGGEMAPALAGGEFTSNWNDLTLGDLLERIRVSMPQNDPGSLGRAQKTDILAYMLFRGGYPAGETELPSQTEALKTIAFKAVKP
jgi:S-disulfanyl-L-cysteine oxidoreductase SoxD